jgi:vacuolar-type H+-ATPase subunit I/STV1
LWTAFQLGDETKAVRRELISTLVDVLSSLKESRKTIINSEPNNVSGAMANYNIAVSIFVKQFIKKYSKFVEDTIARQEELNKQLGEEEKPPQLPASKPYSGSSVSPGPSKEDEPKGEEPVHILSQLNLAKEKLKAILQDVSSAGNKVSIFFGPMAEKGISLQIKILTKRLEELKIRDAELERNDPQKWLDKASSIIKSYEYIIQSIKMMESNKGKLQGDSLQEMFANKAYQSSDPALIKLADGAISRWLRTLSLKLSDLKKIKSSIYDNLNTATKNIDSLLDSLESKNLYPGHIDQEMLDIIEVFKETSSYFMELADMHNNKADEEQSKLYAKKNKDKKPILKYISSRELGRLKNLLKDMDKISLPSVDNKEDKKSDGK